MLYDEVRLLRVKLECRDNALKKTIRDLELWPDQAYTLYKNDKTRNDILERLRKVENDKG